jgi:hypothetical protein
LLVWYRMSSIIDQVLSGSYPSMYDIILMFLHILFLKMNFNATESLLYSKQQNTTLNDHLLDLFIEEWSIKINYSKYFDDCAPSFCSYTITDQNNLSYAVTLFISLYGGLIIILRLIASFLIKISLKFKYHSRRNTNIGSSMFWK